MRAIEHRQLTFDRGRRLAASLGAAVLVAACAAAPLPTPSPAAHQSTPRPTQVTLEITPSPATPVATPTPIPTAEPVPAMTDEDRANLEDWLRQLNAVDPDVALGLARAVRAYDRGGLLGAYGASGPWSEALDRARQIRYARPSTYDQAPPSCWTLIAELYEGTYQWMGKVVDALTMPMTGPGSGWGPVADPEQALIDLALNYHPAAAGGLTAEAIEAACEPAPGVAAPLPVPEGGVVKGMKTGKVTVFGSWAFALIQNTGTDATKFFPFTRFRDAKGKLIKVGYGGSVTRIVPSGATTGAAMFGSQGPPRKWKSASIEPSLDGPPIQRRLQLTLSPVKGLWTSLGLLAVTTASASTEGQGSCGLVGATAVRDGVAVGGGTNSGHCASGTQIVRLIGAGEPGDDLYVELLEVFDF